MVDFLLSYPPCLRKPPVLSVFLLPTEAYAITSFILPYLEARSRLRLFVSWRYPRKDPPCFR